MGHDYLQAVRMAVRPYTRSARCEAPEPAADSPYHVRRMTWIFAYSGNSVPCRWKMLPREATPA